MHVCLAGRGIPPDHQAASARSHRVLRVRSSAARTSCSLLVDTAPPGVPAAARPAIVGGCTDVRIAVARRNLSRAKNYSTGSSSWTSAEAAVGGPARGGGGLLLAASRQRPCAGFGRRRAMGHPSALPGRRAFGGRRLRNPRTLGELPPACRSSRSSSLTTAEDPRLPDVAAPQRFGTTIADVAVDGNLPAVEDRVRAWATHSTARAYGSTSP
jgi:hypothetical protein